MRLIAGVVCAVMGILVLMHVGDATVEIGAGLIAAGVGFLVP